MSNKFPVQLTVPELFQLADLLRTRYKAEEYYANKTDEDVADVEESGVDGEDDYVKPVNNKWARQARDESRAQRARYDALYFALTGDHLTDG